MKKLIIAVSLVFLTVGVANAAGLIRLSVDRILLTQNGYGVATDSKVIYFTDENLCIAARDAYINETSVQVGGKQVYTLNKAVCGAPNITVNQ